MESFNLIKYKWQHGVYTLQEMKTLVKENIITKDQFFYITRFYYDDI